MWTSERALQRIFPISWLYTSASMLGCTSNCGFFLLKSPMLSRGGIWTKLLSRKLSIFGEKNSLDAGKERETRLMQYLLSLKNYEKIGVPPGAGIDSESGFDLGRMNLLLSRMGDPLSKYKVVHVAGTKGKGSTVFFLSNILRSAGYRVGTYTSPHIVSVRERIACGITDQVISTSAFTALLEDLQVMIEELKVANGFTLTYFEVLTALAFEHFAREKVDIAVVEAGLGGARDATNVVRAGGLAAAVIMGIDEEHMDALGGSLKTIALAKAGIIKTQRPVILGKQLESLAEIIIKEQAASKRAPMFPPAGLQFFCNRHALQTDSGELYQLATFSVDWLDPNLNVVKKKAVLGQHLETLAETCPPEEHAYRRAPIFPAVAVRFGYLQWRWISTDCSNMHQLANFSVDFLAPILNFGAWILNDQIWNLPNVRLRVLGLHQCDNATAAIQAALCLRNEGWKIPDLAIRNGLENTTMLARFQLATAVQAKHLGVDGSTVIFDGAHTKGSAAVLAQTLREAFSRQALAIVVSMANDKDHSGFASTLLKVAKPDVVITTMVSVAGSFERSTPASSLAETWFQAAKLLGMDVVLRSRTSMKGLNSDVCGTSVNKLNVQENLDAIQACAAGFTSPPCDLEGECSGLNTGPLVVEQSDGLQVAIKQAAHALLSKCGVICVTGSFHTVSAALSLLPRPLE